jgi:hypothetical protein
MVASGTLVRRCVRCGGDLSRYNTQTLCGPCVTTVFDGQSKPPAVPSEFWRVDQMRQALATWHMGRVIFAYRCHPYHGRVLPQELVGWWLGLTQARLSRIEKGPAPERLGKLVHYAQVLGIPGELLWFKLPNHQNSRHGGSSTAATPNLERLFSCASNVERIVGSASITVIAGRDDGRILMEPPNAGSLSQLSSGFGRGLMIAEVSQPDGTYKHYGLDRRQVAARISTAIEAAPLVIPRAFEIDNFTLGLLWAVGKLDDPLLEDDAALATVDAQVGAYLQRPSSFAGGELASDLSLVSRMWLGSAFCTRYVTRHLHALETPKFWARDQRGEEACAWLLFEHKYRYLERTKGPSGNHHARIFCVPPPAVSSSPSFERTLLLLAIALNESFGIRVDVCTEPEYNAVPGFVLDPHGHAIVANWLRSESIWKVDITNNRVTVREFRDAIAHAHAHSITTGADPLIRMRTVADYLDIDWEWFAQRCSALSQYGAAGLAQPRSRLLSLIGVDRACCFVADLTSTAR